MHRNVSTSRTIGTHSSSRVVGRSVVAPVPSPGAGDPLAVVPSASMVAAEPGAIVDSSTSNRSTAKRTGAMGSSGGGLPAAPAEVAGEAADDGLAWGLAAEPWPALPDGAAEASGSVIGVTV